jgi:DNA-binding MarR family transcriptional regulator
LQRDVCDALYVAEGNKRPLRELRRRLGEPDRSNLRRAIRGLLEREIVEESRLGGERHVGLTFWGCIYVSGALAIRRRPRPVSFDTRFTGARRVVAETREEERRRRQAEDAKGIRRVGSERRFVRKRTAGPTQKRILHALWRYSDPLDEGLPVNAVRAILGGDRSNTRRTIRTLVLRGELEESMDGERIRLSRSAASSLAKAPPAPLEPVEDERAREILRAHQDAASI